MGGMVELNQPQQRCCFGFCPSVVYPFAHHPEIVISTEAAHSLTVSTAVEKSASPPRPFPSHRGAFAFVSPIVLFPQPKKNQSFWGAAKETLGRSERNRYFAVVSAIAIIFRVFRPKIACQAPKAPKRLKQKKINMAMLVTLNPLYQIYRSKNKQAPQCSCHLPGLTCLFGHI
jgi:hypothetical protein